MFFSKSKVALQFYYFYKLRKSCYTSRLKATFHTQTETKTLAFKNFNWTIRYRCFNPKTFLQEHDNCKRKSFLTILYT